MLFKYEVQKIIIKFLALFIFKKRVRQIWRNKNLKRIKENYLKSLKWGVSYSIFDGEELLESSIKNIRDAVDYINVVYQTKSWDGTYENTNLYNYLIELKNKGLIDEIIYFEPNYKIKPGKNEVNKRNLGLKYAIKAKCTHFMCMDTDEFYIKEEFIKSKEYIAVNNIEYSFCPIVCYGASPKLRRINLVNYAVPFFAKIGLFTRLKLQKAHSGICLSDPTRTFVPPPTCLRKHKVHFFCSIQMHHMTYIRKDLKRKLKCSSNENVREINMDNLLKRVNNGCVEVDNIFNIENFNQPII